MKRLILLYCLLVSGGLFAMESQPSLTIEELTKLADEGNINALWSLAQRYKDSTDIENSRKALFYLQKAADLGFSKAQYVLGRLILHSNKKKAISLLQKAADQDLPIANYILGSILMEKEQYYEIGKKYLEKGISLGYIPKISDVIYLSTPKELEKDIPLPPKSKSSADSNKIPKKRSKLDFN